MDPKEGFRKLDEAKCKSARLKPRSTADRKDRAEKAAREKALREGVTLPDEPATRPRLARRSLVRSWEGFPVSTRLSNPYGERGPALRYDTL